MEDLEDLHLYMCLDGRIRAYSPKSQKIISYPRALMEQKLGRPLKLNEQVHHIDGDPLNNDLSNLEIMLSGEHQRMHSTKYVYSDQKVICPWCGKEFVWTAKQQKTFRNNQNRTHFTNKHRILKPFCSKQCAGSYSRKEQMERDLHAECALNGEPFLSGNPVPTADENAGA